jgi:hypothetical protein
VGVSLEDPDTAVTVSATTKIQVVAANLPPTATATSATCVENGAATISLTGSDPNSLPLTTQVGVVTHGTVSNLSPSRGTAIFTPEANFAGTATVTFTVSNGSAVSAPATATIQVLAVNQAPTYSSGGNVIVAQGSGAYSAAWATGVVPGPANESAQTITWQVAATNQRLFSSLPALSAAGVLTFTPVASELGVSTVSVTPVDSGGTANGGTPSGITTTFTITVSADGAVPTVLPLAIATMDGVTWTGNVQVLSSSPDATLTYDLGGSVPQGTLAVSSVGVVTFIPASSGSSATTMTVSDGLHATTVPVTVMVSKYSDTARPRITSIVAHETVVRGSTWTYTITVDPATVTAGAILRASVAGNPAVTITERSSTAFDLALPITGTTPLTQRFTAVVVDSVTGASDAQPIILAITDAGSNG